MGRRTKMNVEYFPHYISRGAKIQLIERKYGNDGYAVWFKVLESLAEADHHYLDLSEEMNLMFLADRCMVDEPKLNHIIGDLAKMGQFDEELWEKRILYSPSFYESVAEVWKRRNAEPMSIDEIKGKYLKKKSNGKRQEKKLDESAKDYTDGKFSKVSDECLLESDQNSKYYKVAKAYYLIIEANLIESGSPLNHLKNAKYKAWVDPIRLMIEKDGITKEQLTDVWNFLQIDNFWKTNIQTTKKLRENFVKLHSQAKRGKRDEKGGSKNLYGDLRANLKREVNSSETFHSS